MIPAYRLCCDDTGHRAVWGQGLLPRELAQISLHKLLAQAGSPGMAAPGGTAWRTLCLWQPSVMAEIPGEQQDSSLSEALEATDDDIYVHLPRSPQRVVPGQSKAMCL